MLEGPIPKVKIVPPVPHNEGRTLECEQMRTFIMLEGLLLMSLRGPKGRGNLCFYLYKLKLYVIRTPTFGQAESINNNILL